MSAIRRTLLRRTRKVTTFVGLRSVPRKVVWTPGGAGEVQVWPPDANTGTGQPAVSCVFSGCRVGDLDSKQCVCYAKEGES